MTGRFHGGDLAAAAARFGIPQAGWVDLSTGINPWPYPVMPDLETLYRLPDSAQIARLLAEAAAAYGMGAADRIAAAPGTQALIQWLPRLMPAGRVAVVSPTYGEHAPAWRQAGHEVFETAGLPDAADADTVVVTNPNNPDGRLTGRADLVALAGELAARGGRLVVDEAFADVAGEGPSIAAGTDTGIVALRSFGKFYGLPGLRLGFALTDATTAAAIAEALGPWPVSTIAADAGAVALADRDWRNAMRATLAAAADRLDGMLTGAGVEIVGGTTLFRLTRHADAAALFERLGNAGIYVRPFADRPEWLRFGIPGEEADWVRLAAALEA